MLVTPLVTALLRALREVLLVTDRSFPLLCLESVLLFPTTRAELRLLRLLIMRLHLRHLNPLVHLYLPHQHPALPLRRRLILRHQPQHQQ